MVSHSNHFLDTADARVIFSSLASAEPNFSYKEYKGTPPRNGQAAVSRVLSITTKGENVYIELKTGPGKLTNTGAITPNGQPTAEVNVAFKLYEARRMAAAVLAYLQAWDILRMLANQHMVSQPVAYLLVPTTGEVNGNGRKPAPAQPVNGTAKSAVTNGQPRPVTRKGPSPHTTAVPNGTPTKPVNDIPAVKTAESASPLPVTSQTEETAVNGKPIPPHPVEIVSPTSTTISETIDESGSPPLPSTQKPLKYQDGVMVDGKNLAEAQTFRQFVTEKKQLPPSKTVLQAYYRQQQVVG